MKKFLAIILATFILVLSLASCNQNNQSTQGDITLAPSSDSTTQKTIDETTSPISSQDDTIIPSGEQFWAVTGSHEIVLLRKYGSVDSCAIITFNAKDSVAILPDYYEESKTKTKYPVIWIGTGRGVIGTGSPKEVIIPDSVLEIKANAFNMQLSIETVRLNEGLLSIENMAFWCCKNLKNINLPTTLVSIGDNAFQGTAIESLVIPNSVKTIGKTAFASCNNLKSVTLPKRFETQVNDIFGTHASEIVFTFVAD